MHKDVVYKGSPAVLLITVMESDGETPRDLTGLDLHWRTALSAARPTLVHVSSGIAVTGEGDNVAEVPLSRPNTLALPATDLYHELYAIVDGEPIVLFSGHLDKDKLPVQAAQAAQHVA